jgi:hypothetical protein
VRCREYPLPPQRGSTDSGADVPSGKVPDRIREHHGITVPSAPVRNMTEKHAERLRDKESLLSVIPGADGEEYITAGTDGSMIPPADTEGEESDRRKNRRYRWKEARLTLCHPKGPVTSVSGCAIGGADEAGDQMFSCAIRPGMGQQTGVHCIGDGAPRVREQADRVSPADRAVFRLIFIICAVICPMHPKSVHVPIFRRFPTDRKSLRRTDG